MKQINIRNFSKFINKNIGDFDLVTPINNGLVHYVYKINTHQGIFYLKVRGESFSQMPSYKINPSDIIWEKEALEYFHNLMPHTFPKVIGFDENNHALLITDIMSDCYTLPEYLESTAIDDIFLQKCAQTIVDLHKKANSQEKLLKTKDIFNYTFFDRLKFVRHPELEKVVNCLDKLPKHIINGDLSPKNIGVKKSSGELVIYDLEFVHANNIMFDIAFFIGHIFLHSYTRITDLDSIIEKFLNFYSQKYSETLLDKQIIIKLIFGIMLYRLENTHFPYTLNSLSSSEKDSLTNRIYSNLEKSTNINDILLPISKSRMQDICYITGYIV